VTGYNICLAAAELAPFAKTGGLADVSAALAAYLHRAGHDLRVFLPFYRRIGEQDRPITPVDGLMDVVIRFGFSVWNTTATATSSPTGSRRVATSSSCRRSTSPAA
jgi:starch synthase